MGAGQSTEKKSPTKDVSPNKEEKVSPRKSSSSSNCEEVVKTETPTKLTSTGDSQPTAKIDLHVSEEEVASVEAVSKKMKDTVGGTSIEIVLSPAIKKPKSRISPPTSPTANLSEEAIAKKLAEAEERKQSLEQEKLQKLAANLEKISLAQEKKEKKQEKFAAEVLEKIESKQGQAEELRKKQMVDMKEKVSEHSLKIEKAQRELEAAIEAAKVETQAAIDKKMHNYEENKNVQLEEMLTALKDHSERIKNVRTNMEDLMKPKAQLIIENIAKKDEVARELKAKQEAERKLKVEEMEKRRELVRQNKEKIVSEQSLTPELA